MAYNGSGLFERVHNWATDKANNITIRADRMDTEMDGFATCRELSSDASTKDIPVVFVTSKDQKADRMWAEMQGAKAYITKPYQPDEIIDQLKKMG